MPKPRAKRAAVRKERKRKRHEDDEASAHEASAHEAKRARQDEAVADGPGDREFFGMLADDEQEYFRRADELLELNQFPSPDERAVFLDSVYREAQGKELKLASSQSCSRLMERLMQLASTVQKKRLFEAFGGHFLSLVRHRFASHCCEALFLRSAGAVSHELAGFVVDTKPQRVADQQPEASMESLFLATLDELEGHLSFLLTDRFASHTLRVLLLVLSGRPLEDASMRALTRSKRKEDVSVAGSAAADEQNQGRRAVPSSFTLAVQKIIHDSTAGLDATGLRVLVTHPIGNPTLQLLLELDMELNKADKDAGPTQPSLLQQLLPGAPQSLADGSSEASEFISGMVYDQIGSRLIETLVAHCPGRIFKALNHNIFLPRIEAYVRNDISSYPAIKVLDRLGKDHLIEAVAKTAPTVPQLVSKARFNVLRTLFERCAARGILDETKKLMKGLRDGCGSQPADLITTLCCLGDEKDKSKDAKQLARNNYAIQSHGAQLLTSLLSISGPSKGVQEAILALPTDLLLRLATTSMPAVRLLTTALSTASANSVFQKSVVGALTPHVPELATSQFGHNLVNAVAEVPGKGKDLSLPLHVKEAVMQQLAAHEAQLRDCWMGRSVWRAWKGDVWKTRRADWRAWMRELDAPQQPGVHTGATGSRRPDGEESKLEHTAAYEEDVAETAGMEDDKEKKSKQSKDKKGKEKKSSKDKDGKEKKSSGDKEGKEKKSSGAKEGKEKKSNKDTESKDKEAKVKKSKKDKEAKAKERKKDKKVE